MNLFLKELSKKYPHDMILLGVDGAAWYKSKTLKIPDNIQLFVLFPHKPEMNSIEQIWKEIHKLGFKNEIFHTPEKVVDRLCDTINSLASDMVKSITDRMWILSVF